MADIGMKGSQLGYDILDVQDYLQSFNSSWPHLKLDSTGVYSGAVSHNLGYPPFHIVTRNSGDGRVDQLAGDSFAVSSSALTRFSGADTPRYFIFRQDLTTNYTATTIDGSTTASGYDDDFGFRLTKPGADISSDDMRDYALHSGTSAPLIHMVDHGNMTNTGGGLGWERTVSHNLGYTPTVFVFLKPGTNGLGLPSAEYGYVPTAVGVSGRYYSADSSSVYITADSFSFTGAPAASVVVLKNPFTTTTINMSYP